MKQTETENKDLQIISERVKSFCKESGYFLAPEADKIFQDIVNLKNTLGDYYCPCQKQHTPKTVCVCQAVRNGLVGIMGHCFCNLIFAEKP